MKPSGVGSGVKESDMYIVNGGRTVESYRAARWVTTASNVEIQVPPLPKQPEATMESSEEKGAPALWSAELVLDCLDLRNNDFGVVLGLIPPTFSGNARLPVGWGARDAGYGIILGTGQALTGDGSGPVQYAAPAQDGDRVGIVYNFSARSLEFTVGGRSLGPFPVPVDAGTYRLGVSLIKSQRITFADPGHATPMADKINTDATAATPLPLGPEWQRKAIRDAGDALLQADSETGRLRAVLPSSSPLATHTNDAKSGGPARGDAQPKARTGPVGLGFASESIVSGASARARLALEKASAESAGRLTQDLVDTQSLEESKAAVAAAVRAQASRRPLLVLDLPNICMRHGDHKVFSCAGLAICIEYWRKKGFRRIVAFVPSHLLSYERVGTQRKLVALGFKTRGEARTQIPDNVSLLLSLRDEGYVVATPPQDYDDSYCIRYAHKHGGYVVTNDRYRDCVQRGVGRRWLDTHLLTFAFVKDEFLPNPDFVFDD